MTPDKPAKTCVRCHVSGRVQGVFFRASTREQARALGLCGSARNLPDGRVEVIAYGPTESVERLRDWLRQGPPMASVEHLSCEFIDPPELVGFEIG